MNRKSQSSALNSAGRSNSSKPLAVEDAPDLLLEAKFLAGQLQRNPADAAAIGQKIETLLSSAINIIAACAEELATVNLNQESAA